jgi:hypothetical protein
MKRILFFVFALAVCICGGAQKQIYIPKDLHGMNLQSDTSLWSMKRMVLTPNFAIFWQRGFGHDLSNPPQLEGHDYSLEGTAYGGDYDQTIGAFWVAPNRIHDDKLNCDRGNEGDSVVTDWGGGFYEMTSQWMLWQVNPNWVQDENYHWQAYRGLTHKAFLHLDNIYHSPYILEYWGMKHGLPFIAEMYREGRNDEDVVMTYKRMNNLTQKQFCDEMFGANCHIVNFDYPGVWKETRKDACS